MTFWYDSTGNDLVGNQLDEFVTIEDGDVWIHVDGIMNEGRGHAKLKEMISAVVSAIIANGGEN